MPQGSVRIIAGQWRGRYIEVPKVGAVRPTANRIRETVFNWLTPHLHGAYCLDAFAGSGALGFEALSRGAAHVTFLDNNKKVITQLSKTAKQLQADNVEIQQVNFPQPFTIQQQFDIIFLDPPFQQNLIMPSVLFLQEHNLLSENALLYLEVETALSTLKFADKWQCIKQKTTGEVTYYLWQLNRKSG